MTDNHGDACWGHCDHCKWWPHNQYAHDHLTAGRCEHPELVRFELQVNAQSGCNHFEPLLVENRQMAMAG